MFNNDICSYAYELISFKHGMMIDNTKLYTLILVWIPWTLTQDHRVGENGIWAVILDCIVKWQTFAMVDFVREMTAEKPCEYGEYLQFEHLLLFFPKLSFDMNQI